MRQRAGYLSAIELQGKLHDRYTKYLASHENALASVPEREASLNASHLDIEKRHREATDMLQGYIDDGERTERSMHVRSLFSATSSIAGTARSASTKHSSRRSNRSNMSNSDRLSEARVQAELAKTNVEQQQIMRQAQQKKFATERENALKLLEFEQQAIERKRELERERRQLKEQARLRDEQIKQTDIQWRLLQEENERKQKEYEEEIETQRQITEYEKLRAEVRIRKREELRSALGSDFESSDDECDDITKPRKRTTENPGFQSIDDQQAKMQKLLQSYSKPLNTKEVTPQHAVTNWLQETDAPASRKLEVPENLPAQTHQGYLPPIQTRRDEMREQTNPAHENVQNLQERSECSSVRDNSNAALFSQVLQENGLPKPKMLTFDGDPKKYKLFMASFRNNVEARLNGDDQLKLTLFLDQCTGEAFELIEECVMLKPEQGYRTAINKLERRFGKNHLIARSYIDGVKKGGTIKPNDIKALIKLADEMRKCQNVLTELQFASDLDSTGTIESTIDSLPEHLQNQWVKRSNKILNTGREPTFNDLTSFVEERADDYNSKYGQYIAEKRSAAVSKPRQHEHVNKPKEIKRLTTLATSTTGGEASTAGHDAESTCTSTSTSLDVKKSVLIARRLATISQRAIISKNYRFRRNVKLLERKTCAFGV